MDYLKGIVFIILAIFVLSSIGKKVSNYDNFSKNMLIGYVLYSAGQAIIGMFTQLLHVDFLYYKIIMILYVLAILLFICKGKAKSIDVNRIIANLKEHIMKYKLIYILATILCVLSALNLNALWMGNHEDDGWYLMKVALSPFLKGDYDVSYATGFNDPLALSRAINTFELDYAFWSNILGIFPSVFCKVIMACLNYFIILCGFDYTVKKLGYNSKGKAAIFLCVILFFGILPETLANHGILQQQDAWHFNAAVWYGSGMVRSLAFIVLVIPFINDKKISLKKITFFCIASFALMSKASQALPIIFLATFVLLQYFVYLYLRHKNLWAYILFFILTIVILLLVPSASESMQASSKLLFSNVMHMKIMIVAFLIFMIVPFIIHNETMKVLSTIIMIMLIIAAVPNINNLFLLLATTDFVVGRTITMFSFNMIILAAIYIGILISYYLKKEYIIKILFIGFGTICIGVYFVSMQRNLSIIQTIQMIKENPKLIPESTYKLSQTFSKLSKKYHEQLYILGPSWINNNGYSHSVGTILRITAPNVINLSGNARYTQKVHDDPASNFSLKEQVLFDGFLNNLQSKDYLEELKSLLHDYPVNIIYVTDKEATDVIEANFDFTLLEVVEDSTTYYVLGHNRLS